VKKLLTLLALTGCISAHAQQWVRITETTTGIQVFADKSYTKIVGDNVKQVLVTLSNSTNWNINLIDCDTGEFALARIITDKYSFNYNETFEKPQSGSPMESIVKWSCK